MAALKSELSSESTFSLNAVLRGTMLVLIIMVVLSALAGLIYYLSSLSEKTIPLAAIVILFTSIFLGGFFGARQAGCKGLFHGLAVGAASFLLIFVITLLLLPGGIILKSLLSKIILSLIAGSLGGILGVAG